jgi:serine/threonine-protein kinase
MGSVVPAVHLPSDGASRWEVVAARLQAATIGEFEILTELGRGGMAAVYLARELSLNRPVAIKVMAPGLLLGAAMVERFRQEAITVANLQHAHIVSIHAVRQVEDLHYFVMQFVPGRTIEGVIKDHGALPVPVVLAWMFQIGSALGYAHRRGVIHRDVKPGNILLNIDGEAVVTDFGIAKVAENPALTQTGAVVGTPLYMSPEQCYAKELTGASDQYSLGIVAYEMLAGRPPFSGASFALMRAHTDDPPPPLRDVRPDVPEHVEAALLRMLAKKPEQRFHTMADALASLGAAPLAPADPIHATLQELAAATDRLESLRDVLRTPASPIPKTRERPKPVLDTPRTPVPAT